MVKTIWSVAQRAMWDWWADNCMRLSASLAFYTALSLAPLVIIVVGVAGLITDQQHVANQLEQQIELLMGPSGRQLVHTILTTTEPQGGTLAALIGIVTLAIGATAVFGELQAALNLIWEVKPKPINGVWGNLWSWLRQRFFSLAIVLAIAFLLLVSLVISAALAGITYYFQGPDLAQTLLSHGLEAAVSILVITFLFALLFRYVPDAAIHWHDVWLGSFISAILFTLGKVAIGYYIGRASIGSAYGAAGSLIVLLVWVYYSSLIIFFGAEFTHAWATRQRTVEPKPYAEAGAAPQTKSEAAEQAARTADYDLNTT
jgi:membrane protein